MQPLNKQLRLTGLVLPNDLSAFYQVGQKPLIPIDTFGVLSIFGLPLRHFSHKGNELLLLLAFQSLISALQARIRNWRQVFPSACIAVLERYGYRQRTGILMLPTDHPSPNTGRLFHRTAARNPKEVGP